MCIRDRCAPGAPGGADPIAVANTRAAEQLGADPGGTVLLAPSGHKVPLGSMAADVAASVSHMTLCIARRPAQAARGKCFGSNSPVAPPHPFGPSVAATPSPQPARRGSRSPPRRRGRTEVRSDLPPAPPPPVRRNARSTAEKPAPAD
eukprot:9235341-Alexandrium_andersonii.AAC.1